MSKEPKSKTPKSLEPTSQETANQEPKDQEPANHEIKLQETKRPANLRANAMPVDGFVLSVDGKLKRRYDNEKDAAAAGAQLKQSYPVVQVAIYDAARRVYTPVELQKQE